MGQKVNVSGEKTAMALSRNWKTFSSFFLRFRISCQKLEDEVSWCTNIGNG